jgi:hypothetical protein
MEDNNELLSKPAGRGISYPFLSLVDSVDRAQKFYDIERKNAAPVSSAVKHWGYSEKSSGGKQTIAALQYFGLMQYLGTGEHRQVKLTERAFAIIHNSPESEERYQALRDAVASPKLYAELISKFSPSELPSDETLRFFLLRTKDVSPNSIDTLIKNFRASLSFAGYGKIEDGSNPNWNRVKQSLLFEDTPSALPRFGSLSTRAPVAKPEGMREEACSLDEGTATLQWPGSISKSSVIDLCDWLDLVKRKIERAANAADQANEGKL